ncbi:MAG: thioredoxin family protein [Flavobacteriaceae bacterium]
MKKMFWILLLGSAFSFGQEIQWMSFSEALAKQKETPKKIILDVYTKWCGPCKLMEKKTFNNPDVAAYINAHYYAVKFNAEGNETINYYGNTFENPNYDETRKGRNSTHQFTQFLGVRGYPTTIFVSETGDLITPVVGYLKPQQLEMYLKMIKQGDYQVFSSPDDFQRYQENFVPRFRGE